MPTPDTRQRLTALLGSIGFIAAGLWIRSERGPAVLAWMAIVFGALGGAALVYRTLRPGARAGKGPAGDDARPSAEQVVLRDGREYRVDVMDGGFALTHLASGSVERAAWDEVHSILLVAIDGFPVGDMSYIMLRRRGGQVEVPTDAAGNAAFLEALQSRFPGFDNAAFVQAMGSLHGFWTLWSADATTHP